MSDTPATVAAPGAPRRSADQHPTLPTDNSLAAQRRSTARGVLVPLVASLLIGGLFVGVYLAAFHNPKPHQLPVAVVAPADSVSALQSQAAGSGDALEVVSYPDRGAAETAVAHREVLGALVVAPAGPELLVAGANGPSVTQTLQGALGAASRTGTAPLRTTDVAALSDGDSRALSVFYGAFGVVLAGFLFGLTTMQVGRGLTLAWRAASTVAFSLIAGVVVAWLLQPVFGALPAPFVTTASVVALLALAVSATTAALLQTLGSAGTFVASVVLLVLGNATSTGILPSQYLPGWLEPLASVLPVGVAVRALRGAAYFDGDGLGSGLFVLGAWVLGAGLLFATGARHQRNRSTAAAKPGNPRMSTG